RGGGASEGLFGTTNLSFNVGDVPAHVQHNRALLAQAMQALELQAGPFADPAGPRQPVFVRQVHGTHVQVLGEGGGAEQPADASVSDVPGLGCTVMAADCLPGLFCHQQLPVVGAAHAGWRGLLGQGGVGVLENCFAAYADRVRLQAGQAGLSDAQIAAQTMAWLGPCISQPAFEVGAEVQAAFVEPDPDCAPLFAAGKPGKFFANLSGLARHRLQRLGLAELFGNDGSQDWCTVANPERFFSHRRDGSPTGGTGRFAACIWVA
ncbi:MAG: polyphenol oxidase family protein, partial [Comamonas sp.]|nr:polyphenol oxidase family protein [Comamonas sp.]